MANMVRWSGHVEALIDVIEEMIDSPPDGASARECAGMIRAAFAKRGQTNNLDEFLAMMETGE